ncbi:MULTISPECIES: hypothetical protein [Paenibacillus]|jgi:hypothetical protein|uniref:Uncharacterized protein n=1 Tax=Paenibacillus baimaensis TaxID=2982185 RepID=A0ABT2UTJ8_9BACL|nr:MULTISPECIES: hypothetical protein [Paenibacillus]MCU6797887.1 hypothetical protein [Paenibacillus sp. WQ 127069]OMF19991.1 hypothetical protein BK127_03610 [Paenibacillus sp. FSL H7-0331]
MTYGQQNNGQEQTISVELTLNEALALTGVRFRENHQFEIEGMHKIKKSLENRLITEPNRKEVQ